MDDTAWIPPGSDDAIDAGCRCPVLDNAHGRGYLGLGHTAGWVISSGCPMHWTEDHRHAAPRTIGGDRG